MILDYRPIAISLLLISATSLDATLTSAQQNDLNKIKKAVTGEQKKLDEEYKKMTAYVDTVFKTMHSLQDIDDAITPLIETTFAKLYQEATKGSLKISYKYFVKDEKTGAISLKYAKGGERLYNANTLFDVSCMANIQADIQTLDYISAKIKRSVRQRAHQRYAANLLSYVAKKLFDNHKELCPLPKLPYKPMPPLVFDDTDDDDDIYVDASDLMPEEREKQ